jgi:hypothetical protein
MPSRLLSKNVEISIHKTLIYGCETWSRTLKEERSLRVFENRVLRKLFGPRRREETGRWRKLHNKDLHTLYSLSGIIRMLKSKRMRWEGHVEKMRREVMGKKE